MSVAWLTANLVTELDSEIDSVLGDFREMKATKAVLKHTLEL